MSANTSTSPNLIDLDSSPPNTNGSTLQSTKASTLNSTSSAMSAEQNPSAPLKVKEAVVNGPVGQAVQNEGLKTSSEFKDLANSRTTPAKPAATGQPLTHYHSLFYRLLSWKNPRATGIIFASLLTLIFASRYLDILRYTFRALYTVLGLTALAEVAGKAVLGNGLTSSIRPKSYYTIRKESLERFLDDLEQLINFIVIEFQRIVFVENIWVTGAAFGTSFIGYYLIKWLPVWGLTLLFTSVSFLAPLVYTQNKEFIDAHIDHAGNVINAQANQVRGIAAQHTTQATETLRTYAGEYTQKAQQLINEARGKATNGSAGNPVKTTDFPNAPQTEPLAAKTSTPQPQAAY